MFVTTEEGIVSSTTNTIRGATYRRYGEIQYISLPKRTDLTQTLTMNGNKAGSFTLEIEEWGNGEVLERHTYSGIPTGTSTQVLMTVSSDSPVEEAVLGVDYNGDGTLDIAYDTEGEVVTVVTYDTLTEAIQTLSLKPIYKKPLQVMAKVAEEYYLKSVTNGKYKKLEVATLQLLRALVIQYERRRLISVAEKQNLVTIIDTLIKK